MGRVALFGDVGGHWAEFYAGLVDLGMDADTLQLPDDLTVIQVGDLIHRGPNSAEVLAMVDCLLPQRNPDGSARYVQLAGNHESLYLPRTTTFGWHETIDDDSAALLRAWWIDGRMKVAAGIRTAAGEHFLITHAGLTLSLWRGIGSPRTVERAVAAINKWIPDDKRLWRAGCMLGDPWPVPTAGPLWAEATREVYGPWGEYGRDVGPVPFGQVHGHSTAYFFGQSRWHAHMPAFLKAQTRINERARHVEVNLPGGRIIGIDPGHGEQPARRWSSLLFPDAALVAH